MAAHKASALNRGSAIARSSAFKKVIATNPPTQREIAMTCTTREPIARACEPLDAEWLSKTGAIIATKLSKRSALAPATPLMRITTDATSRDKQS